MTRLRAMSYNVRYANRHDHHDVWPMRRDAVTTLVRFHRPDVVGFQEPLPGQRKDLRESLPAYDLVGRGRHTNGEGEGCPIAVRRERWTVVEHDTFWLSETPETPSVGWGASHPRIATWARVRARESARTPPRANDGENEGEGASEATGVLLVSTHLDHESARARLEAARLLRRRLPAIAGDGPVVLLGDFNCTAGSPPHRTLTGEADEERGGNGEEATDGNEEAVALTDAAATADLRHGPRTSVTDFGDLIANRRIDHVLVSPDVDVDAFATLADRDDRGRYPSDHLPVLARLRI